MIKIIGAILVTAGATAAGVSGAVRMAARGRSLRALLAAVIILEDEICTRMTPTPDIFDMLAGETPEPASSFFANICAGLRHLDEHRFNDIWREAVEVTPALRLNARERQALLELGYSLGRYDAEAQRPALSLARRRFEKFAADAEEERRRSAKTSVMCGFAAGILAVIMFI